MKKGKRVCPRCQGNGYIKITRSVDDQRDGIVQCPMCNSEGAIPVDNVSKLKEINKVQRILYKKSSLLNRDLVKSLINKIRMLQKQKVFLQKKLRESVNHD
jgi:RecJ-like exonuclease